MERAKNLTDRMNSLNDLIKSRRSVFPDTYNGKTIPEDHIRQVLENANWAPSHRLTQPWRFKVFQGQALQRLSDFMGEDYKTHTPLDKQADVKYNKTKSAPLKSSAVIALCMQAHPDLLPEWEEIAATACAVQNMWLTCTDLHIGCYWSSPGVINRIGGLVSLPEGQKCIGLFYMGYSDLTVVAGKRTPYEEKTEWLY